MIEDVELRELFQTESEEHLQMLDDGLLRLETNPGDKPTLEEVFRAAHSLKGTARMLGVTGVETVAHQIEEELGSIKRGQATITSAHIDRYSVGLTAMRRFCDEAVKGTPADVDLSRVLAQLSGEIPVTAPTPPSSPNASEPSRNAPPSSPDALEPSRNAPPSSPDALEPSRNAPPFSPNPSEPSRNASESLPNAWPSSPNASPLVLKAELALLEDEETEAPEKRIENADDARRDDFKIQTMRVPPAKLDALMTLASELTVTTTRVVRGMTAFEEIGVLWEEWNKDVASHRALWQGDDGGKELAAFRAREQARLVRLQGLWTQLKQTTYQDVTRLNFVADELEEGIRNVRLLPLSQIFNLFPRLVRDLARELQKEVNFLVEGGETAADKRILEELKDPLMHMIRNAIDHGIELPDERQRQGKARVATIALRAFQTANNVMVELRDDGRGLDLEAIKRTALKRRLHSEEELAGMSREQLQMLIFAPGFSTSTLVTDVSGRGVGMDVVRSNIELLKGTIRIQSEPGRGTTFLIRLPSTLATTRVLLVTVAGRPYALPVEWVQTIMRVEKKQIFSMEGRQTIVFDGRALPIVCLSSLLELETPKATGDAAIYVVMEVGDDRFGVQVDGLVDEQEVMLKPLGALLKRVRNVSGVTILGAGEICMVLNVHDLAKAALLNAPREIMAPETSQSDEIAPRKLILLAEDSITTRTQEKRILESAGYEVVTAVDGADAWSKLPTREFDGVVSDVEMPNMDGLTLASRIRENPRYNELPIILVTSLASDADKQRGIDVGANAYITKGTFEQKALIETLRRLV